MNAVLVVGSLGYDTITTPQGRRENILGGSANYFSLAATHYAPVRVVGVVGSDYKSEDREQLESRGVDLRGLQQVDGQTFAWEGRYESDMNEAITLATHLNVFEAFHPTIPESYRDSQVVFLANIDPVLQLQVLEQVKSPRVVAADTMNFWIQSKRQDLARVIERVDLLLINEAELHQLTGLWNTIAGVKRVLEMGPKAVVVKRGEYGFVLFGENQYFILPAYPVENVVDPTGAGDTFAGGFLGHLTRMARPWQRDDLKAACVEGCLMASFTVQDFGLDGVAKVTMIDLEKRRAEYRQVIS